MSLKRLSLIATILLLLTSLALTQEDQQPPRPTRPRRRPAPFRKSQRHYMDVGHAITDEEVNKLEKEQDIIDQQQAKEDAKLAKDMPQITPPIEEEEGNLFQKRSEGMKAGFRPPPPPLVEQWNNDMSDFLPEILYNFEVASKSDEIFYEELLEGDTAFVRGMFIANSKDGAPGIDFFIIGPNKKIVYSSRKRNEGMFSFNATIPGQYSFIFNNLKWRTTKHVTFGLQFRYNVTDNPETEVVFAEQDPLLAQAIDSEDTEVSKDILLLEEEYMKIIHGLSSLQIEQRVSARQQDMHNDSVDKNNSYSYYFGYAEALGIVCFASFQVYYIMRMLDKRVLL